MGANQTCAELILAVRRIVETYDGAVVVQVHRGEGAANNATYSLAAFLAAAGENTYFGDGDWAGQWTWYFPLRFVSTIGCPSTTCRSARPSVRPNETKTTPLSSEEHLDLTLDTRNSLAWMHWS